MTLDTVGLVYLAVGLATLAAALLPWLLGRVPILMPMVFVGAAIAVFAVSFAGGTCAQLRSATSHGDPRRT